jgi:hypothetical protein
MEIFVGGTETMLLNALTANAWSGLMLGGSIWAGYQEEGLLGAFMAVNPFASLGKAGAETYVAAEKGDYQEVSRKGAHTVPLLAATIATVEGGLASVVGKSVGAAEAGAAGAAEGAAPRAYSVATEAELSPAEFGLSRARHFEIANETLRAARQANPALADLVPEPAGWGRPPPGWVWQHATTEQAGGRSGVLQLVPRAQHTPGSPFWRLFRPLPNGGGGYKEWAVPAGAPPN